MNNSLRVDYKVVAPYIRFVHEVEMSKGAKVPERFIYDHEFIYVVQGSGTLRIEDRIHSMRGGDLLYIRPHLINEMQVSEESPMRCFAVHFDYIYLGESLDFSPYRVYLGIRNEETEAHEKWLPRRPNMELSDIVIPERMQVNNVHRFLEAFQELRLQFENSRSDSQLWLRSAMLRLIGLIHQLLTTKEGVKIGHPHAELVLKGINYMEENYNHKITVPLLAQQAMLTPRYYGTIFKEATGQTISEYLSHLRIKKAKSLLMQNLYSVQEVADKVGIGDIHYFSKLFKKLEGLPPKRMQSGL